jgi:hypothetical protein
MTRILSFGSKLSLLLSLLLLVPRVGLAATVLTPEPSGLPGTSKPAPLWLTSDSPLQQPERRRTPDGLRILAEVGAGLLTSAVLGAAGGVTGLMLCANDVVDDGGLLPCLDAAGLGLFVGFGVGFPLGVLWGGEATEGNGKFYGPLLGAVAGLATGFLLSLVTIGGPELTYVFSIPFLMLGPIVGYELTVRRGPEPQTAPRKPAVASSRPRIQPMLGFSPRGGALLGLGGSF